VRAREHQQKVVKLLGDLTALRIVDNALEREARRRIWAGWRLKVDGAHFERR